MDFKDLHPPILEIPAHQIWHRVQRSSARRDSVRLKGYVLAPTGGLTGNVLKSVANAARGSQVPIV